MAARQQAEQGLESKLWATADALRGSMDASEYKNVVLGLIFLKYVSDAFDARRAELDAAIRDPNHELYFEDHALGVQVVLDDRDRYAEKNVFWVPPEARWDRIQDQAKQPNVGEFIDDAMLAIEADNDRLKGVLPVVYANPTSTSAASARSWTSSPASGSPISTPTVTSSAASTSTSC